MSRNNYPFHLVPKTNNQSLYVIDHGEKLSPAVMTAAAISARGKRVLAWRKFTRALDSWLSAYASAIGMTILMLATAVVAFYGMSR